MNQRRHAKAFPLVATLVTIALAICFVTFAVKALMVKYQVVQGGTKIKQLEREYAALTLSNQSLETEKARLTSFTELKRKQLAGYFKDLKEIPDSAIITIDRSGAVVGKMPAVSKPTTTPVANATPTPAASRTPKATVAAANVIIGREGAR